MRTTWGTSKKELKHEEFCKGQLWKAIKIISAIELHIRSSEDDLGDTAGGILAKAEAQVADQTEETETGMKKENRKPAESKRAQTKTHRRKRHGVGEVHRVCQDSRSVVGRLLDKSELQQKTVRTKRMLEQKRVHETGQEKDRKERPNQEHGSNKRQRNRRGKTAYKG